MTHILDGIYGQFPGPPARTVLLQFSRALMEDEANQVKMVTDKYHILNDHNLKEINKQSAKACGDGEAKSKWSRLALDSPKRLATLATSVTPTLLVEVNLFLAIESDIFVGTEVSTYSVHALFLAVESDIFIGTEVSTYSVHAVDRQFHRRRRENYFFDQGDFETCHRRKTTTLAYYLLSNSGWCTNEAVMKRACLILYSTLC
jgi:hypothetical protein